MELHLGLKRCSSLSRCMALEGVWSLKTFVGGGGGVSISSLGNGNDTYLVSCMRTSSRMVSDIL